MRRARFRPLWLTADIAEERLEKTPDLRDMTAMNLAAIPLFARKLSDGQSKVLAGTVTVLLTFMVGWLDYISGPGVSMSAYYLLPIALAAWYVGARFAVAAMMLGMVCWTLANMYDGDPTFGKAPIAAWNATVQLISDLIVLFVVTRLRELQASLERRVSERAAALTREISERERVQEELLRVGEREQRRIGQDLHDGLCQHLAATALNCQLLHDELAEQGVPGAGRAKHIVDLIENSIRLSRQSARGLDPVAMDAEGLMLALEEVATTTTELFRVRCRFECDSPVLIHDAEVAEHLFRIAQEAVRNAVTHSRATAIAIRLETTDNGLELRVEDNGCGLGKEAAGSGGMGLRIMPQRARLIGARFSVSARPEGGTTVVCVLPQQAESEERQRERAHA